VRQETPRDDIDDAKAQWLIGLVRASGRIRADEFEMLLRVLEEADASPAAFSDYVLGMVRTLTLARVKQTGGLAQLDIDRLRRVVFAKGGEGNVAVTQTEAEALFDLNDALKGTQPNPTWSDFFSRAVANAVLFTPTWAPDAGEELARDAWLEDTTIHPL